MNGMWICYYLASAGVAGAAAGAAGAAAGAAAAGTMPGTPNMFNMGCMLAGLAIHCNRGVYQFGSINGVYMGS